MKICPMYKAALLEKYGDGYIVVKNKKTYVDECDEERCRWWVKESRYICIRGEAPCPNLGEECVTCPDYRNVPKTGHCGRIYE